MRDDLLSLCEVDRRSKHPVSSCCCRVPQVLDPCAFNAVPVSFVALVWPRTKDASVSRCSAAGVQPHVKGLREVEREPRQLHA